MNSDIVTIVSLGVTALTVVSSFLKEYLGGKREKEKLSAEIITKNRLVWIDTMRAKASTFVELYLDDFSENGYLALKKTAFEINLMIGGRTHRNDYRALEDIINTYVEKYKTKEKDDNLDELLDALRYTLKNSYNRAKLEAGIDDVRERKITRKILG